MEHFKTGNEDLSPDSLGARLTTLMDLYNSIVTMSEEKQAHLETAAKFFAFKAQCERVKFWLSERQRDLTAMKSATEVDEICKSISGYENNVVQLRQGGKNWFPYRQTIEVESAVCD